MRKSTNNSTFEAMETFINSFANFWSIAATAQAKYQYLASLNAQIANASDNEKTEIEARRDVVQSQFETESSKLFEIMEELSKENGEISAECYEMLQAANETICVFFAKVLSTNSKLSDFFLGTQRSKNSDELYNDED